MVVWICSFFPLSSLSTRRCLDSTFHVFSTISHAHVCDHDHSLLSPALGLTSILGPRPSGAQQLFHLTLAAFTKYLDSS